MKSENVGAAGSISGGIAPRSARALAAAIIVAHAVGACGGGGGGSPTEPPARVVVEFVYAEPTMLDPAVAAAFPGCVSRVGHTHIHPSWRSFVLVEMTAVGDDRWEVRFTDVPVGAVQRIRVSDPNACARDPNGASTRNVFANGVLLTRIVDTPGTGTEPGLAFTVSADGIVTP